METLYDEMKRRRQRDELTDAARDAAKSAGLWGGLGLAASELRSGNRSIPNIVLRGLGGAALAAPVAAGATLLGGKILGTPHPSESSGYARRGALGGALGAGLLGGGLGLALGSGKLGALARLPGAAKAGELAHEVLPLDNLVTDQLKKWARTPGPAASMKMAALLGGGGAALGGVQGLDEGMALDTMRGLDASRYDDERYRRRYAEDPPRA